MAYEMRISDWSSDGCSSDLCLDRRRGGGADRRFGMKGQGRHRGEAGRSQQGLAHEIPLVIVRERPPGTIARRNGAHAALENIWRAFRSEEHTSELQSLMRISYAVFCLKKKTHDTIKYYLNEQINTR